MSWTKTRAVMTLASRLMMAMTVLNMIRLVLDTPGQNTQMATISTTRQSVLTSSPTVRGSVRLGWARLQSRQATNTKLMKRYPWGTVTQSHSQHQVMVVDLTVMGQERRAQDTQRRCRANTALYFLRWS